MTHARAFTTAAPNKKTSLTVVMCTHLAWCWCEFPGGTVHPGFEISPPSEDLFQVQQQVAAQQLVQSSSLVDDTCQAVPCHPILPRLGNYRNGCLCLASSKCILQAS